ncbi:MAG: hypothetical protein CMG46_00490 [Candidatus Marinimicrobia bacterium]|nr:hypothetical protein [Candidatus Neomarinimicrobiota bacterium]|tara:strand:+ start:778 stop:1059 length:282 start_codon:yes stop_codon:yes gene_type:complete
MKECSCNLIDWTGKDGKYIHIESGEIYDSQKHGALDCQTKVKEGIFNYGEYFNICKYIPGDPKSNFPSASEKIVKGVSKPNEGIPPISKKLFK